MNDEKGMTISNDAAKVVESLVLRGDLSGLNPEQRARHYVRVCESLGLNPDAQPFAYLRLNGKEILYATRGATDQLAAIHRITREIIDGPKVMDLAGTKVVMCAAKATHPNGRTETSIATLPFADPANVLMKCECVPLDSEILTRRGFKRHDELTIGEEVLAYSAVADRSEWVPLENVTVYPEAPVFRFTTERGGFSMRCTRDHSWAVDTRGAQGRKLIEANAVKTHHRVKIAARAVDGGADLSPVDAAVLGWVMCDGTIQRRGSHLRLGIYQSKPARIAEIRELLTRGAVEFNEVRGEATVRTFPGGNTSECLPQHSFWLTAEASRGLLARAGIEGPSDLPRLAAYLSHEARRAMLDAMMAADGSGGRFGKKRKPGVMEAWQILCTLEGVALGKLGMSSVGEVPQQQMLSYDYVAGSNLSLVPDGDEAVWCPTTKHGTWVMRQGGRISITGNTKAKRRVTMSILGLALLDEMELETIPAAAQEPAGGVDLAAIGIERDIGTRPTLPAPAPTWSSELAECVTLTDVRGLYAMHARPGSDTRAMVDDVRAWLSERGVPGVTIAEASAILSTLPEAALRALSELWCDEEHPVGDRCVTAARTIHRAEWDEHSRRTAHTIVVRCYAHATGHTALNAAGADLCALRDTDDTAQPEAPADDVPADVLAKIAAKGSVREILNSVGAHAAEVLTSPALAKAYAARMVAFAMADDPRTDEQRMEDALKRVIAKARTKATDHTAG